MMDGKADRAVRWLGLALVACGTASLLHFSHNAAYLESYPNMPAWLSSVGVWAAWLAVTAVGATGYLLLRAGHRRCGLVLIVAYAMLALDSLGHYGLAPFSAHTFTMNLTILLDVATALLVLSVVAMMAARGSFKGK